MTSRKNDPSLAQELEKERTRPLEEAERRGPRKPKTNGRTLTPVKNGARSHGKSEYARGVAMMKKNAGAHTLPGLVVRRNKHTHTHTQTHIIFIGNLKSGEQSAKIYQGDIVSGLWAPPVFFDPITARMPEFDKPGATKGYRDPPIEEWPGSP